jgi:hypothetical protein
LRVWNTWNNFDRFDLRQIESESDSLRNVRTELRVLFHLDVFVGDGLSNHFAVTRLGVARPILHECGWHAARFKMGDTETAEAVETLFLNSEFFQNWVEGAAKEVRLKKWCPRASPEVTTLSFTITYKTAGTAKIRGSHARRPTLWVELWVGKTLQLRASPSTNARCDAKRREVTHQIAFESAPTTV